MAPSAARGHDPAARRGCASRRMRRRRSAARLRPAAPRASRLRRRAAPCRQQGRGRGPEAYACSLDGSGVASGAAVCVCRSFRPSWVLSDGAVSRPEASAPAFEVGRRCGEWDEHGEGQVVLVSPKIAVGGVDVDSRLALGPLQLGGHVEVSQARAALGQVRWRRHLAVWPPPPSLRLEAGWPAAATATAARGGGSGSPEIARPPYVERTPTQPDSDTSMSKSSSAAAAAAHPSSTAAAFAVAPAHLPHSLPGEGAPSEPRLPRCRFSLAPRATATWPQEVMCRTRERATPRSASSRSRRRGCPRATRYSTHTPAAEGAHSIGASPASARAS